MSKKLFYWLNHAEMLTCSLTLLSIVFLQFIQVVARYGFGRSISWAEEASRFALLGLVYISAAIGARYNTHIRVGAHLRKFPQSVQFLCAAASALVWLSFNAVVIYNSVEYIQLMARRPQMSGALLMDMRWIFALIPLGFALQSVRIIQLWITMTKTQDFTPLYRTGDE